MAFGTLYINSLYSEKYCFSKQVELLEKAIGDSVSHLGLQVKKTSALYEFDINLSYYDSFGQIIYVNDITLYNQNCMVINQHYFIVEFMDISLPFGIYEDFNSKVRTSLSIDVSFEEPLILDILCRFMELNEDLFPHIFCIDENIIGYSEEYIPLFYEDIVKVKEIHRLKENYPNNFSLSDDLSEKMINFYRNADKYIYENSWYTAFVFASKIAQGITPERLEKARKKLYRKD